MRLCDVGSAIQEVMESHEVELDGKTYQVCLLVCCQLMRALDSARQIHCWHPSTPACVQPR